MTKNKSILYIGNFTTIIKFISLTIGGIIFGIIGAFGLKLPVDVWTLSAFIGGIIGFVFSYYDASNPNTYFNHDEDVLEINVDNLTDEQITAIQTLIDESVTANLNRLDDIDVAGEYEELIE